MITAIFYKECFDPFKHKYEKKSMEIHTGKTTIMEAFKVALDNGHDPTKRIEFRTN